MELLIEWWAKNSVAVNLLAITILFCGLLGYGSMNREFFPTYPYPGLQVKVLWPGASAREVEEQVTTRIEQSVKDLEEISHSTSVSREGLSEISIYAKSSANFSRLLDKVDARIASIPSLPSTSEKPLITQFSTEVETVSVVVHGQVDEAILSKLARSLRAEMMDLAGVSKVNMYGIRSDEISIEVDEAALRRFNISIEEIARSIQQSSLNLSLGNIRTTVANYRLLAENQALTKDSFNDIVVKESPAGAALHVRDLAEVNVGFEEEEFFSTLNGEPAILLSVMSSENMDLVLTANAVNSWLSKREQNLPVGVSLSIWTDLSVEFKSRLKTIGYSALSGLLLVFIILFLTIRPLIAVWVAFGIVIAFSGAFIFLPSTGTSLNMLSTFAFLLVLGIVVDDAIVVGEQIHSEIELGSHGVEASIAGTYDVFLPVVFGVLTSIIVFVPWILVEGPLQNMSRQIAWVAILTLCFSLLESLLVLPSHLSYMKRNNLPSSSKILSFQSKVSNSIVTLANNYYGPMLKYLLRQPGYAISAFLSIFIIGYFGIIQSGMIKTSFLPEVESEQIYILIEQRNGTPYSRSIEVLKQLQDAQNELKRQLIKEAGGNSKVIKNMYARASKESVIAIMKLGSPENRKVTSKEVANRLRVLVGEVPSAKAVHVEYAINRRGADIEFSVQHNDRETLRAAVEEISGKLKRYPALRDVTNEFDNAYDELHFQLRPGSEKLGVTMSSVSEQIRDAYYGREIQRVTRDGRDVRVMIRYKRELRNSIESLKAFRIRTPDGRELPLLSVVDISYSKGLKDINHRNGKRSVQIGAYLKEPIADEIISDLRQNFIPYWENKYFGVKQDLVGSIVEQQEFINNIIPLLAVAFFVMYCMIAIALRSYTQPLVILAAIPFAALGGIFGHLALSLTLSLYSYFGIVAAAGVVINDNLVLVDRYNRYRQSGRDTFSALVDSSVSRFRPILITSITTFAGLLPLMTENSTQAEFLKPIIVSLGFGVVFALFVTLFLVPAVLLLGSLFNHRFRSRHKSTM